MSNKEKQIEEMAKVLCRKSKPCIRCEMQFPCTPRTDDAQLLYDAGYRKASDVVRKIFAEISEILFDYEKAIRTENRNAFETRFAELRKKYESEGGK